MAVLLVRHDLAVLVLLPTPVFLPVFSLLVELTSSSHAHGGIEEAFESAIHSVSGDLEGPEQLWWEYLVVRREEASKKSATAYSVKVHCTSVVRDSD